jgi:hypothetical protein
VDADLALVVAVGVGGVLELQQLLFGQVAGKVEEPFGVVAVVDAEDPTRWAMMSSQDVRADAASLPSFRPWWRASSPFAGETRPAGKAGSRPAVRHAARTRRPRAGRLPGHLVHLELGDVVEAIQVRQ